MLARAKLALGLGLWCFLCLVFVTALGAAQDEIDWVRARALHRRVQQGEKLSEEDEAYYKRAKALVDAGRGPGRAAGALLEPREKTGFVPLTELAAEKYKGESGGLYGGGSNEPPAEHAALAKAEIAKIVPLDAEGRPDKDGKIVLMSIGMSNTTQEFSRFVELARADRRKSPSVVVVDAAQGGQAAIEWADPEHVSRGGGTTWQVAERFLTNARVTPKQVQAIWLKQALIGQGRYGEFPKHAQKLEEELAKIVLLARQKHPNLRVVYLSSRIYAGYASGSLNPEPYAYEGAFAVRSLIRRQIEGDKSLNVSAERGEVKAPVLLWGPYLWADGTTPRKADGLTYTREDLAADGTHPSNSGRAKVARLLLEFFTTDPLAKPWFTAE